VVVNYERSGAAAIVTIDRPERRNAVDGETAAALLAAYERFAADEGARVIVLTGAGDEAFCAGADLKAIGTERGNQVTPDGDGPMGPSRMRLSKPVIAAVEGHAVAGGLELAIWCDLRVVAADAIFGVYCRRWGVPLIDGGTIRLPRLIGEGRALDLILTGRSVAADEALRIGLADRVVQPGTTRARAEELAEQLAELPQACLRNDRLAVLDQHGLDEQEALRVELEHGMRSLQADALDGAARFAGGAGRHGSSA
jgi:enoyl-CoA hydratase